MKKDAIQYSGVPQWNSDEARRKEEHVARFLGREYKDLMGKELSLSDIGMDPSLGPMFDQTENLMETHYDQELDIFSGFLDRKYFAYTMAYYDDQIEPPSISLEKAQENKFSLICKRIRIEGDERILNVGCGFGSFERYLLENYPNIKIVGITPSKIQADYIREKMADPSHVFDAERFELIQEDFENLELEPASFDLVTSIGLIEAVRNLKSFHEKVSYYLKPGGRAFHHLIVSKIVIPQFLDSRNSLIGKYFPGGRVWPFDEIQRYTGSLRLEKKWFVNGMNYWRTLDEWHNRFWKNIEDIRDSNNNLDIEYWNDYFILCKACFLPEGGAVFGNGHYLLRKIS